MCDKTKFGLLIANTLGKELNISLSSEKRLKLQVAAKPHPAGLIWIVGKAIVFEVSHSKSNLIVSPEETSSIIDALSGQVILKVKEP